MRLNLAVWIIFVLLLAGSAMAVGENWTQATANASWSPRDVLRLVVFNNKMWLMGGADTNSTMLNDVWSSTDGENWTEVTNNASWSPRVWQEVVNYDNKMWLMGGYDYLTNLKNDVWYSIDGENWTEVAANVNWIPRFYSQLVTFDNKMWLMGGLDENFTYMNDVWSSTDGENWTEATANASWLPRLGFQVIVFDSKMWLMGGEDTNYNFLNDVWYSTDGANWTEATANANWMPRVLFQSLAFDNKMWVLGGGNASYDYLDDVWYSTDGENWTEIPNNVSWSSRVHFQSVPYNNKMWLMGGFNGVDYLNDVWYASNPLSCSVCNETCSPCGGGCNATDMTYMFDMVTNFDSVVGNISGWNTSCVTNMWGMFIYSDFNQDISGWDVSNVTSMGYMFDDEPYFNKSISNWDTSHVTNMQAMFQRSNFNQDISSWNTSSVTDMSYMFNGDVYFNQNLSAWDTSKVTDMTAMLFNAWAFNQPIGSWNTSSVVSMVATFGSAHSFNQNISSWDIRNVTDMTTMFTDAQLSVPNYDSLLLGWSSESPQMNVVFDGGNSQYTLAGKVGRDILTDIYNWTITDGGLYVLCTPDWYCSGYEACQLNDTQACDAATDNNSCGSPYAGNYSEFGDQACDYCIPSWSITSTCVSNSTEFRTYNDSYDCYALTGLFDDSCYASHADCDQWINCTYLPNEMDCGYDVNPIIDFTQTKIQWRCTINDTTNYSCVSYIKEQGATIQTNPQLKTYSSGVIPLGQESREYFSATGGLVQPYFLSPELKSNKTYVFGLVCSSGNGTLTTEHFVTPMYQNLEGVAYGALWVKENIGYLIGGFMLLLIIIAIILVVVKQ